MRRKTTNIDLVELLTALDEYGEFHELIENARNYMYHDLRKFIVPGSENGIDPKVQLVRDLKKFPELNDVRIDVLNCEYDEADNMSESDVKDLRVELVK